MCVYKWISHFFGWQMTKHHTKGWLKNSVGSFYMYACEFLYVLFCLTWGNSYKWIWHFTQHMNYITLEGRLQISVDSFLMYICKFLYVYLTWGTHTQSGSKITYSLQLKIHALAGLVYYLKRIPFTLNLQLLSSMSLNLHLDILKPQAFQKKETNPWNSLSSCPHWHTIHSIAMLWLETGTKLLR